MKKIWIIGPIGVRTWAKILGPGPLDHGADSTGSVKFKVYFYIPRNTS